MPDGVDPTANLVPPQHFLRQTALEDGLETFTTRQDSLSAPILHLQVWLCLKSALLQYSSYSNSGPTGL